MKPVRPDTGSNMSAPILTPEREQRGKLLQYWYVFVVAAVLLFTFALHASHSLQDPRDEPYRDLGSFYVSGWAAAHHLDPYGFYPLVWEIHPYGPHTGPTMRDVNLNPPCMLPLFELMSKFPIQSCVPVYTLISAFLFVASGIILSIRGGQQYRKLVCFFLSVFTLDTLWIGEDYSLFLFLSCLTWLLLSHGWAKTAYAVAGVLIAFKPSLGLWLIFLVAGGYWREALTASLSAGFLSVIPLFRYGPAVYGQWLRADALVPHWTLPLDISLMAVFTRLGVRPVGIAAAVLSAVGLVIFVRRYRPNQTDLAGLAVCAGVLCAPLAWFHYAMLAAPFFGIEKTWGKFQTWTAFLIWVPELFGHQLLSRGRFAVLILALPHIVGVSMMLFWFLRDGLSPRGFSSELQRERTVASASSGELLST